MQSSKLQSSKGVYEDLLILMKNKYFFIGKGIKVKNFKVDKCLGVGFLGRQTVKNCLALVDLLI